MASQYHPAHHHPHDHTPPFGPGGSRHHHPPFHHHGPLPPFHHHGRFGRHRHGYPMHGPPHFRKHLMLKLQQKYCGKEGGRGGGRGAAARRHCGIDNDDTEGRLQQEKRPVKNFQAVQVHREETNNSIDIALDLPGFNTNNLTVILKGHVLVLHGQRQNKLGDIFIVRQRFRLNQSLIDLEDIQANFDQGVLELTIPKRTTAPRLRNILISTTKKPVQMSSSKEEQEQQAGVQDTNAATTAAAVGEEQEKAETLEEEKDALVVPFEAMLVVESEQASESAVMMETTVLEDGVVEDLHESGICTVPETDGYCCSYRYNTGEDSSWEDVDCRV